MLFSILDESVAKKGWLIVKETGEFRRDLNEIAMALFFVNNLVGLKALVKSNLDKTSLESIIHALISQLD